MKSVTKVFLMTIALLGHGVTAFGECEEQLRERFCYINESNLKHISISKAQYNLKYLQQTCTDQPPFMIVQDIISEYRRLPLQFKKLMCSLKRIVIFDDIIPTHLAQVIPHYDESSIKEKAYTSIKQKLVREISGIQDGISMRIYQGIFHGDMQEKSNEKLKATFKEEGAHNHEFEFHKIHTQLPYILIHELAHVLDEYNSVNPCATHLDHSCNKRKIQQELAQSFANISWNYDNQNTKLKLKRDSDLARNKISKEFDKIKSTHQYVSVIKQSEFVSSYATFDQFEDFAETVTHFFMHSHYDAKKILKAKTSEHQDVDLYQPRESLNKKYSYIENLLEKSDLKLKPTEKAFRKIKTLIKSRSHKN